MEISKNICKLESKSTKLHIKIAMFLCPPMRVICVLKPWFPLFELTTRIRPSLAPVLLPLDVGLVSLFFKLIFKKILIITWAVES